MHPRSGLTSALLAMVALAGCGGGGAGGTVGVGNVRPDGGGSVRFTSFFDTQPQQTVQATGLSQTTSATAPQGLALTSRFVNRPETDGSIELFFDDQRQPTAIAFHSLRSSPVWSGPGQVACGIELCLTQNQQAVGAVANAMGGLGWNYQTFGYWLDAPTLTTREIGAITAGAVTPPVSLPTSGVAVYNGLSAGIYVDAAGASFEHIASMSAVADFGAARSISFSTSRTTVSSLEGGLPLAVPEFDLAGAFTVVPGSSEFSGTVVTADQTLSGNASGRFYGPAAEEIGGIYSLIPPGAAGVETFTGAFGGRR